MGRVNYVVLFGSALLDLTCAVLRKNDVLYDSPLGEDKYLLPYIKKNASKLDSYDAAVIDLGDLKDTDEQVMEAVETIRFVDDSIRIIVIASKEGKAGLLSRCFLNGIYNLISAASYIDVRSQLEKCILTGMSYKDASVFRNAETIKKAEKRHGTEALGQYNQKTIIFMGTGPRMGVTHSVLSAAYTLRKCGYIAAVMDCTGSRDYLQLMQSYELNLNDDSCFTLNEIDIYIKPALSEFVNQNAYNYILYDTGQYGHFSVLSRTEKDTAAKADARVLLCGSKPWEIEDLSAVLKEILDSGMKMKYLFNFTSPEMQPELWKMMKPAGIGAGDLHIMEYLPDPFTESVKLREILEIQENRTRKSLFKNRFRQMKQVK